MKRPLMHTIVTGLLVIRGARVCCGSVHIHTRRINCSLGVSSFCALYLPLLAANQEYNILAGSIKCCCEGPPFPLVLCVQLATSMYFINPYDIRLRTILTDMHQLPFGKEGLGCVLEEERQCMRLRQLQASSVYTKCIPAVFLLCLMQATQLLHWDLTMQQRWQRAGGRQEKKLSQQTTKAFRRDFFSFSISLGVLGRRLSS